MKKYNSLLNNRYLLYFLFILTLLNIGYFLYLKDNHSILLFSLITVLIYLFSKNMIIVLGLAIIIINILILARDSREGLKNSDDKDHECSNFTKTVYKKLYVNDISGIPDNVVTFKDDLEEIIKKTMSKKETDNNFYDKYKSSYSKLDKKDKEWLSNKIYDISSNDVCKSSIESLTNENTGDSIKDNEKEEKKLSKVIDKIKSTNPQIEESLKILNGIDINEINNLINKLNNIADHFPKVKPSSEKS